MKVTRQIMAANFIERACDGDVANYSDFAKSYREMPVGFFEYLAEIAEGKK